MRVVEDVFDTSGRPPKGWMNALFDGGPYADDVGRCVPGPPPADTFDVGGVTYYLRTVGSWSDPENPIAVYGLTRDYLRQHPEVPTAVICGPDHGRGEFTVRLRPSGQEFSASSWRAFWDRLASYRGEGGRSPLVDFRV
jgi:hypothetical protein